MEEKLMEIYEEERRKAKKWIYQSKKKVNDQFEGK